LFGVMYYAFRQVTRAEALAEREHQRSETLLVNILPARVAERLKDRAGEEIADAYPEASVLFADMAGFTARASDTPPADLVRFLNGVFTRIDALVEKHGLEKIKTSGDAYMVVSGVPQPRADHAEALAALAIEMRDALAGLVDPKGRPVPMRIGIASGPVVAGVVGTRKFFYDVWGDAVNTAARMEQTGEAGKIQVAPETQTRLKERFVLEERGTIEVRGKGPMRTWFLVGRRAA
jgi:adenylate cyclase